MPKFVGNMCTLYTVDMILVKYILNEISNKENRMNRPKVTLVT